jgi:iron(III) transport system permease protein
VLALIVVELMGSERIFQNRARPRSAPAVLRPRNRALGVFAWGLVLVTALLPFWALVDKAGGLETYRKIFDNVKDDLGRSFELALEGGLVVAFGGLIIGLAAERLSRGRGFALEAATLLPFAFPAVVVGVAINVFWASIANWLQGVAGSSAFMGALASFVENGIYRGEGIFMACYLMLFLCFATRCIRAALARVEPRQIEAGLLSGRGGLARFRAIVLPVILPGFLSAFVIAFILSLGELGASLIVQPPDWSTVQIRIFNMIHFARDEEVAALCVMLIAAVVLPALVYVLTFNRKVELL